MPERPSSPAPPPRRHRWYRWLSLVAGVFLISLIALFFILHHLINKDYLERQLQSVVQTATDSLYHVTFDSLSIHFLQGKVQLENVRVRPDSVRHDVLLAMGKAPASLFSLQIPSLHLNGIQFLATLWERNLSFGTLQLSHPHLSINRRASADSISTLAEDLPSPSLHVMLAERLPAFSLDHIYIDHGTLTLRQDSSTVPLHVPDLSLHLAQVQVDSIAALNPERVLFSEDIEAVLPSFRHLTADSLFAMEIGYLMGSTRHQSLQFSSFRYAPLVSDTEFRSRHRYRAQRPILETGAVTVQGLDYRRLLEERASIMQQLLVDSLRLDLYLDKTQPQPPTSSSPFYPHTLFQSLQSPIHIDTIRFTNADLRYSERAIDGSRPGTVTFEHTTGTVAHVSNTGHPALTHIAVESQFMGAGALQVEVAYDLLNPTLDMTYRGTLGAMNPQEVNPVLVNLTGINIERGMVDGLWFEMEANESTATGQLQVTYRDLKISIQDKVSGARRLRHRIQTFLANRTVLHGDNVAQDGSPPRTATVTYTRRPQDPWLGMMWRSVRNGLFYSIGLDPPS